MSGENKTEDAASDGGSDQTNNLLSPVVSKGSGADDEKVLVGVKVRGNIALVCDVSGSMAKDFPPLIKELRKNFPKDTPLILVQGCHFAAPDFKNQIPVKLSQTKQDQEVLGVDLSKDAHVYVAENTTDAVLMAVTQFRRDTVMFNNDLQDGGSQKAIEAFQGHRKKYGFTLSGRSLNRDAPQVLRDFIKQSKGDFKVNPINRTVGAAINWKPMDLVFVLDEGAGMAESAGTIKQTCLKIAKSLKSQGMDCRFAVLPCRPESDQIPRLPLSDDVDELERKLTEAAPMKPGNAWPKTDALQALEEVLELDFRKDASPIVFLITNNVVENEERLKKIAEKYDERGIEAIIQANGSDAERFGPLYANRGQFYTLAGEQKIERKASGSDHKSKSQNVDFGDLLSTLGQDSSEERILVGVKVRGKLALVCDISGSMRQDFPPLIKELREKFPKDTPLILVNGCYFGPPNPRGQQPVRDSGNILYGIDFSKDPYVYRASNTTDAIIMAVRQFGRDTVMFNNDLQDRGSNKAIAAFETLWEQRKFSLSGRSLNRDAPEVLKDFIKKSGGDFKVDPISRVVQAAVPWRP